MNRKLSRGETRISCLASQVVPQQIILSFLFRHLNCDWGSASAEQSGANEEALLKGLKITSVYAVPGYDAVQIVTEIDKASLTTISLAVETSRFEVISFDAWLAAPRCPTCGQ